jgi:ABC-type Na+ transport system ATPase subunit NatA
VTPARSVIQVSGCRKTYGSTVAIDDVSFDVAEGEIFGLIGPNGAGKTTTMECVEGLRVPDRGRISVLGLDPFRDVYALQQRIGVQLQQAQLQKRIKVWEAVHLWASLYGKPASDGERLLEQLGLADKRRAWFMTLSGGQKQRLFIALALVNDPEVVFLDELTTGLDPQARRAIWDLVRGIVAERHLEIRGPRTPATSPPSRSCLPCAWRCRRSCFAGSDRGQAARKLLLSAPEIAPMKRHSLAFAAALVVAMMLPLLAQRGGPPPKDEPMPRLADGTPNLGRVGAEKGVWAVPWVRNMGQRIEKTEAVSDLPSSAGRVGLVGHDLDKDGSKYEPLVPFMDWSRAVYDYHVANESKYDPEGYCLPPGGPRMMATPYPMEIIQLPEQKRIIMTFEGATHIWREIYMDGRPHPTGDALNPTYLGHSVGKWEGDTLVVDVVGFNEQTWIDYSGHPHTDLLHVTEKFTRRSKNVLHYEATIDDPGAYTKPWTAGWNIPWRANAELAEYICQENNQYLIHLTDDFGKPLFGKR